MGSVAMNMAFVALWLKDKHYIFVVQLVLGNLFQVTGNW
jgi:hypothetical protein